MLIFKNNLDNFRIINYRSFRRIFERLLTKATILVKLQGLRLNSKSLSFIINRGAQLNCICISYSTIETEELMIRKDINFSLKALFINTHNYWNQRLDDECILKIYEDFLKQISNSSLHKSLRILDLFLTAYVKEKQEVVKLLEKYNLVNLRMKGYEIPQNKMINKKGLLKKCIVQ